MKFAPFVVALALLGAGVARAQPATTPPDLSHWQIEVTGVDQPRPCAGDSIRVVIRGFLPNPCWVVRRIEIAPLICLVPCAPQVRVLLDDRGCLRLPCAVDSVPFESEIHYASLPAGAYSQVATVYAGTCLDTFPPSPVGRIAQAFKVAPDSLCGVLPGNCLISSWTDLDPASICNTHFDALGRAAAGLRIASPAALRALEGHVHMFPDSAEIAGLEPVGPAAGMTLVSEREPGGIHFVMFSASGTPIPATLPGGTPPEVLAVHVQDRPGPVPRPIVQVYADRLVGADAAGDELPECPRLTAVIDASTICRDESGCDANFDGRISVRDLVAMLICLEHGCADSPRFDCNGDSSFTLDDVICCAHQLLHHPRASGEPTRPAAGTRIVLGEAVRTADGWRVPITVDPLGDLAAARLVLRFPAGDYTVTGVTRVAGGASWLPLFEADGGELRVGVVDLAAGAPIPSGSRLELAIDLRERATAAGGVITIEDGEFSARDGAALTVALPPAPVHLPAALELSAAPNPFAGATRLAIRLAEPADTRVTVHDLSGRRVATLFAGRLSPGTRDLTWTGVNDRGERVPDGIYFARCTAGGRTVAQKLVLLRTP